jgi:hypothetical protein
VFIDFLAEHLPRQIESSRLDCGGKCDEAKAGEGDKAPPAAKARKAS